MLLRNDVIDLAAKPAVLLVNQTVLTKMLCARGHDPTKFRRNIFYPFDCRARACLGKSQNVV